MTHAILLVVLGTVLMPLGLLSILLGLSLLH